MQMLKSYIEKLLNGKNLTSKEAELAIDIILDGANSHQIAAFLVLLRAKKETANEIIGIVKGMQKRMIRLNISSPVLDIVGTGGDGANTINISTGAAILAASCGVKIAKHGNRSVSSQCGSADVLEALGVNINLSPRKVEECIKKVGIGFCFAPNFHPTMKKIKDIRKNLNIPTCFNILGPLLNPAKAEYLLVGVFSTEIMNLMAEVILNMGVKKALIFNGSGLDELSCVGSAKVLEVTLSGINSTVLNPEAFGFSKCAAEDLRGGTAKENAEILLGVFKGRSGPIANTLIFNAAVALYVYGITSSIEEAIPLVKNSINNGMVLKLLSNFIAFSQEGGASVNNILCDIILNKQREVDLLKQNFIFDIKPRESNKSFKKALLNEGLTVIAEVKRKSPSKGRLSIITDSVELARNYVKGGAGAISVLTDEHYFGGSIKDLSKIAEALKNTNTTILRKDFIIDPIQIDEAVLACADAVLLIVAVLENKLKLLLDYAKKMNIDALVEVHNYKEIDLARRAGAEIMGINNRDLKTFSVDINHSLKLIKHIPSDIVRVSESGISSPDVALRLYKAGFDAVLVGELLVRSANPDALIKLLRGNHE